MRNVTNEEAGWLARNQISFRLRGHRKPPSAFPACDHVTSYTGVASGKLVHRPSYLEKGSSIRRNTSPTRWSPEPIDDQSTTAPLERNCFGHCNENRLGARIISSPIQATPIKAKPAEALEEDLQPATPQKEALVKTEENRGYKVDFTGADLETQLQRNERLTDAQDKIAPAKAPEEIEPAKALESSGTEGTGDTGRVDGWPSELTMNMELEKLKLGMSPNAKIRTNAGENDRTTPAQRIRAGTPEEARWLRGDFKGANIWDQFQFTFKPEASKPKRPASAPSSSSLENSRWKRSCLSSGGVRQSSVVRYPRPRTFRMGRPQSAPFPYARFDWDDHKVHPFPDRSEG